MKKKALVLITLALVASGLIGYRYLMSQRVPLIPRSVLFGNPVIAKVTISPDAQKLAYIAPHNGVLNVFVRSVDHDDAHVITNDTYRGIRSYFWCFDNETIIYQQDYHGDENFHFYATNIITGQARELTPFKDAKAKLIRYNKKHPDKALIALNKENPELFDAYLLNLITGDLQMVAKNPGSVHDWYATEEYQIVAVAIMNNDGSADVKAWDHHTKTIGKLLIHWNIDEVTVAGVLGVTDRNTIFAADPRNSNTSHLIELDIKTGNSVVIYENEQYDVDAAWIDPDTDRIIAVPLKAAYPELHLTDAAYAEEIHDLQKKFKHAEFSLISYSKDFKTWILAVGTDVEPCGYYLYNRDTEEVRFLYHCIPDLAAYKLAPMKPFKVTVRDGMVLEGYVTTPLEVQLPAPTVLYVHGGPWARDAWGYQSTVQWLANRGYVVLQVNYRSSTGYGKKLVNAGNKEWGGKMQDDLTDTVQWAIDQGIADKDRVCIFGGSYGGYAVLAGLAFTPHLYACGVDIVGVSDLLTFMKSIPPYWKIYMEMMKRQVGDMESDYELLKSRSPVYSADKIVAPLMIAQGANDPRVVKAESDQMVAAMKARGVEVEYIVYNDEGHGFARPENRMDFYHKAEHFLANHLGGRAE